MGQKIGRYELKNELGRGGMATVYLAYDPRFQREVAVKVLPRQFTHDPKFLERFEQEARTIAALEDPAIVPVYDFGDFDDAPYLVMRYMVGGPLRQRLRGKPLDLTATTRILDRLAPALDKAHSRGIIHRDLKPDNVLFDDADRSFLADFGIARMAEATHSMTVVGTPAYMSPEQAQGKEKLDGRSDVYALGVMLFEMLTGKQPYMAETPTGQMLMHILDPLPDVLAANPELPPQAQMVIDKVMAKDRDDRYQNAADVAEAIQQLAEIQQAVKVSPAPDPEPEVESEFVQAIDSPVVVDQPVQELPAVDVQENDETVVETPSGGIPAAVTPKPEEHRTPPGYVPPVGTPKPEGHRTPPGYVPPVGTPKPKEYRTPSGYRPVQRGQHQDDPGIWGRLPVWAWIVGGIAVLLLILVFGSRAIFGGDETTGELVAERSHNFDLPANPELGTVWMRPQDNMRMLFLPVGSFSMGSSKGNESPEHGVQLDAYWLDQVEVSNDQYVACVQAGICAASTYAEDADINGGDLPVVGVSWNDANKYCLWTGARLPSEAEWEYAARGPEGNLYPWGEDPPNCDMARYAGCDGQTLPVSSFSDGVSWAFNYNMAGNVWEWVNDWYSGSYYSQSPTENPRGPEHADRKGLRGGGWNSQADALRGSFRTGYELDTKLNNIGFRCALSNY